MGVGKSFLLLVALAMTGCTSIGPGASIMGSGMTIDFDRCLVEEIEGHDMVTMPQAGWAGIENGNLLRLAQDQFDAFVTVDRNSSVNRIVRTSPLP